LTPRPPFAARLDHDLYDARIASSAEGQAWPGGRAAAAFVLIHVEAYEIDAPGDAVRDPGLRGNFGSFFPDYRAHSLMEYGNRIGVFRLLDLLQPLGWTVAAAINGLVARDRPALVRALLARDVAILASGWSASRMITSAMPLTEEHRQLQQSVDAVAQATGQRPQGYASQDYGYSEHTPALLEALGFDHAVDWPNDEIPYGFGPQRKLVMLPAAAELDDAQAMLVRKLLPRAWGRMLSAALAWWQECALPGSVFALPLHSWVAGAAHRTAALRRALEPHAAEHFWPAGPAEIAARWRSVASHPRSLTR
jgi:allantoinase